MFQDILHTLASHNRLQDNSFDSRNQVEKIEILSLIKQNHELIYLLCEELQSAYELQLLCSVGEIFFNIIIHIYVTVKLFRSGDISYRSSIVNVMWTVQEIVRIVIFSLAASGTVEEVTNGKRDLVFNLWVYMSV